MAEPVPPHYANNGAPSLSPDGTKVIVAGYWLGSGPTYKYGVYCLDINVTGGTVGPASGWPSISSDVHTTVSTFDETNPTNAYPLSGAMDSGNTYVYFVNAAGTSLSQRNLSNGNKNWSTTAGSVIGGQLPALDSNNAVWIGTNDGHVIRYNSSGSVVVSVSVVDPVNLLSTIGIGVAIGTNNYLYATTTNSSTGVTNLRGVQ
jgi:hypothetical protein